MCISDNHILSKKKDESVKLDFIQGSMILVDKPLEWTSFDVVNKIRFALKHKLGVKKIKVGHAGTLDPLATGLLILCTGKFTKKIDQVQGLDKVYTGHMKIGATTPTYDAEADEDQTFPFDHIDQELLDASTVNFMGGIEQVPPIYSALKIKGTPAYKLARRGKEVVLKARPVHIHDFVTELQNPQEATFRVSCSKGTYIRSLIHDLGKSMDSGAYLTSLRRTAIGSYHVDNSLSIDRIIEIINM